MPRIPGVSPLGVYLVVMTALGAVFLASVFPIRVQDPAVFAAFFMLSCLASGLKVQMPLPRGWATLSPAYSLQLASLLMFGLGPADILVMANALVQSSWHTRTRQPLHRKLFNMMSLVVAIHATAGAIALVPGSAAGQVLRVEVLLAATTAFFVTNASLVALAVALSTGQPLVRLWSREFLYTAPAYYLGSGLAALLIIVVERRAYALTALVLAPAFLIYRSYRLYLGRLQEEQRHVRELARKHKEASEALAAEKERLAVTLSSIGEGVIAADEASRVILLNARAEQLTGWDQREAQGSLLPDVLDVRTATGERIQTLPAFRLGGGPERVSLVSREDGRRPVELSASAIRDAAGRVLGSVFVIRDLTETLQVEEERLKTSKLESLGLLAGGIAHDFNNVLTGIVGNLALAREGAPPDTVAQLEEAERVCLRARALTRQLLTFSKGNAPVAEPLYLSAIIDEAARFALRGSNTSCETEIPSDLWPVEADEGQVEQLISNIVLNAKQAMPRGGVVRVGAENLWYAPPGRFGQPPRPYVHIEISDDGPGIAPEHLARIFDPYFTTKADGSGLGLAVALAVVKNHSGELLVDSTLGEGSRFHIYLPRSEQAPTRRDRVPVLVRGAGERVLVMDDDPAVRRAMAALLRRAGYHCTEAVEGGDAVRKFNAARAAGTPFDVVILDLTVPGGMDGADALRVMRQTDPAVRAVVASGYADGDVMAEYHRYGFDARLVKPFAAPDLVATIKAVVEV